MEIDPAQLPRRKLDIDFVIECIGYFTKRNDLEKHVQARAKYVIFSAPAQAQYEESLLIARELGAKPTI